MCDACRVYKESHSYEFDCPQVTEWPDHPWDLETRIEEAHEWAVFKRNNPEQAEELANSVNGHNCDHQSHHKMPQDWQGVTVLCKVCDECGKTVNLFQDL